MKFTNEIILAGALIVLTVTDTIMPQVRRDRNEGTFNIPASNVTSNGNIHFYAAMSGSAAEKGFSIDPWAGLKVGVTSIVQLSGKVEVDKLKKLGGINGSLQVTTPFNDHLRFFGASLSGDLYLSTETDTQSGVATTGRPEYNPYFRPSLTIDFDWIARLKTLPLKNYVHAGMVDDPEKLYRYKQLSLQFGAEWKLDKNSYAMDFGAGFYREKPGKSEGFAGDKTYAQQRFWMEPSLRYRLFDRMSLVGAARVLLLQRIKKERPLDATYLRVTAAIEAPIVYKETNTEAIRTMIFIENNKGLKKDKDTLSLKNKPSPADSTGVLLEGLDIRDMAAEPEEDQLRRREEIQQKMEEIEKMLEEIE